jgi:hypothetical protein
MSQRVITANHFKLVLKLVQKTPIIDVIGVFVYIKKINLFVLGIV